MDPLTHTFFGGVLAETGLKRRSTWATATLMIGANLPDVDVIAYFWGSDASLEFRRGHTHGVVAMVLLPVVLTVIVLAGDRWWRRLGHSPPRPDAVQLLGLSALAVLSHPLLDWLNTYGVRLLMPFDGSWFYGDALFIVDPWIWLLLGGTLFLVHSGSRRALTAWATLGALLTAALFSVTGAAGALGWANALWLVTIAGLVAARWRGVPADSHRRALARGAVLLLVLYAAAMVTLTRQASRHLLEALDAEGTAITGAPMVGPERIDPLSRLVVVPVDKTYRFGSYHPLRRPALRMESSRARLDTGTLDTGTLDDDAARRYVERALASSCVRGLAGWLRYPFYDVDASEDRVTVHLLDARYTRGRTRGFGGGVVSFTEPGEGTCEIGR